MASSNYPGSISRHGASWRVRLCVAGERRVYRLDGDKPREDVEQFCREEHAKLHRQHGKALPGPMPFSELLARYRDAGMPGVRRTEITEATRRSYTTSLQAAETFFVTEGGDPAVASIGKGAVTSFMDWRRLHGPDGTERKRPLSARGVAKDRVVLHVLFTWAERRDIVEANPVARTEAPEGDKREPIIISPDQYEKLLEACDRKLRPMLWLYVLTLGETGVRCDSEALWLRWQDVDLERGLLNIESGGSKGRRTKSGKSRRVPMTARLREAMRDHMAAYRLRTYHGKRTEWVFHHELDRRHADAGSRLGGLRRAFASAAERAGLPSELHQHDLRHRRVTVWLAEGKPAHLVQKAMGHSTIRVTEGYAHLVDEDLLQLVEEPVRVHPEAVAENA